MLLRGEIDGLLGSETAQGLSGRKHRSVRLIPDFEAAEQAYHRKTGFFPIMHLIGVRKSIAEAHPEIVTALFEAFVRAGYALGAFAVVWLGNANRLSLPWLGASMERTIATLGPRLLELWFRGQPGRDRRDLPVFGRAISGGQPGSARSPVSSFGSGDLSHD